MITPYLAVGLILWLLSLYPLHKYVKKGVTKPESSSVDQFLDEYLPLSLGLLVLLCLAWPFVIFTLTAWTVFKFFTSESV